MTKISKNGFDKAFQNINILLQKEFIQNINIENIYCTDLLIM